MNQYITYILLVLVVLMLIRNIFAAKGLKKSNEYVESYMGILRGTEGAKEKIKEYYEKETSIELKSKTLIVMIYQALTDGDDITNMIKDVDVDSVVFTTSKKGKEPNTKNSDAYLWLIVDIVKANSINKLDSLKPLMDKLLENDEALNNVVEYDVVKATYNGLKDHKNYDFFNALLAGDYVGYSYEKQAIGIFKKIAATMLDYLGESLSDDDKEMAKQFATTRIGMRILLDLGTYDKFKPVEETETKEVEEDTKEEEK